MKRLFAASTLLLTASICLGAEKELSLNGKWDFYFEKKTTKTDTPSALPENAKYDVSMDVPAYLCFAVEDLKKAKWWDPKNNASYVSLSGLAYYKKNVRAPADWKDKNVKLRIERASERINVWVNGRHVRFYPYIAFAPLSVDITDYLKVDGDNEIVLALDNTVKMSRPLWKYGGIIGDVSLEISCSPIAIDDVFVSADKSLDTLRWEVPLTNADRLPANAALEWEIREWKGEKVLWRGKVALSDFKGKNEISWTTFHERLKTWSPEAPNLYEASVALKDGDKVLDRFRRRFGVRLFETAGRSLRLNGNPIYLRQYYTDDFLAHYRYPQDKKYWDAFYALIKDRGYNAIDFLNSTPSAGMEAADEHGVIVQIGVHGDEFAESIGKSVIYDLDARATMAKYLRVYPSMASYCLTGEEYFTLKDIAQVGKISALIKSIHPNALVMPDQAMRGVEYSFKAEDNAFMKKTPFAHNYKKLEEITRYSDLFGQYPHGAFSYNPFTPSWDIVNHRMSLYQRPLISHEIVMGQETGCPFRKDGLFKSLRYGNKPLEYMCYVFGCPRAKETIDKEIARQKNIDSTRYENSAKLKSVMAKYVFEKIRKCDNIAGYQDIGAHGGFNVFLEDLPGFTAEKFREYNADNVLLLDFDNHDCLNRCYWEQDTFTGQIMASIYRDKPVVGAKLAWTVNEGNVTKLSGEQDVANIPNGTVSTLAPLTFRWPTPEKNAKYTLTVTLKGDDISLRNHWDFWIFKKSPSPATAINLARSLSRNLMGRYNTSENGKARLLVTDMLDDAGLTRLANGEDILLLGGKPFPLYEKWTSFNQGYRPWHNHGLIVREHPVFKDIPNEGWGDWQFYPLTEGQPSVWFDALNIPFDPIVEVIVRTKPEEQRKQAMLFEYNVGKGRLLVSALAFERQNPVTTTLLDSMIRYMSGDAFKPKNSVSPQALNAIVNSRVRKFDGTVTIFKAEDISGGQHYDKYNSFGVTPKNATALAPGAMAKMYFTVTAPIKGKIKLTLVGQDSDKTVDTGSEISINGKRLYDGKNKFRKKAWSTWNFELDPDIVKPGMNVITIANVEPDKRASDNWFMITSATLASSSEKASGKAMETQNVAADKTPPVISIKTEPIFEQLGGEYFAKKETVFTLSADDPAGIKRFDVSIDSGEYRPNAGPFSLSPGTRTIKARCEDNAGNKSTFFSSGLEGGGTTDCLIIQVK